MRHQSFSTARYLAALLLSTALLTTATPVAEEALNVTLPVQKRCENPCGFYGQLCCESGQSCYTDSNNEAQCGSGNYGSITAAPTAYGGGYWEYWTSTWVEVNSVTVTKVYSSYHGTPAQTWYPTTSTTEPLNCDWDAGENPCGNICCKSWQYCVVSGQCGVSGYSSGISYSAPLRPTQSSTLVYITQTIQPTTTVPFEVPVSTNTAITITATDNGGGLSGGAIAGIVIGVILGLLFLIIMCLLLCFRAAWDGLLAIFGFGPSRKRRTEIEYDYHRHGSRTDGGSRRWYGDRPPPPKQRGFGWSSVGLGLGGLAVLLGLKRRHDRNRRRDEKSEYTASSGYYSDYTSSSSSDDRRTRDTRRSRR